MPTMRTNALLKTGLVLLMAWAVAPALAQTRYWTGGHGDWSDAAHWSLSPGGPGGAGAPRATDDAVIEGQVNVRIQSDATCRDLSVRSAGVRVEGPASAELIVAGGMALPLGSPWSFQGRTRFTVRRQGVELHLRGVRMRGDLVFEGTGTWSLLSDLVVDGHDVVLKEGTLITNGNLLQARALEFEGRGAKRLIAGRSIVMLSQLPSMAMARQVVEPGASVLSVNGQPVAWDVPPAGDALNDRDVNVCGTGPGQTPFIVNSQLTTNYNGFGVRCRGECNATVTASVSGGVGPFTYSWLFGGPNTSTWTTACGGPQIVVVTDVGQGISCPAQVNVTEPAPLGVIFFGQGTPPTCADVCNGSRTALAIGGVTPYSYNWNNGAGTNSSFFQLCAGNNTLVITDGNGCIFDTTFFFNLQPISSGLTVTNTSCFGDCDGSAQVSPAGGTPPFTITWNPAPGTGQGTPNATGLCAGNYTVLLVDANGCDTTLTFAITEPPPIVPNPTFTNASCFGTCDGTASVSPTGAAGPYSYQWSPTPGGGQGTANASGLCAGTYTLVLTDQTSGCDTLTTFNIQSPPAINVQGTVTDATCANSCDGTISLNVTGGLAPYSFLWSPVPPSGQSTGSISGLCAGNWLVTVTDASGCDTTVTFTVLVPPPIDVVLDVLPPTCAGLCDGSATATVTGGVGPYTYAWSPAPGGGQGTPAATGLCAGSYALLVTDANGCDTTLTFDLVAPPPLQAAPTQTNVSCDGQCNGTASVVVSGGTAPYQYAWSPAPGGGQGTPNATGLCEGVYTLVVTDANGCTFPVPFTITAPVPLTLSLQVLPASCPGTCDGSAGVIAGGGTAPYTYLWAPAPGGGQGTPNVTGLCAQAYTLTVTDAAGCDSTVAFTVPAPPPIVVDGVVTDATCSNTCDGAIALTASGGNGAFTYTWTPEPGSGQGTANAGGLCPGNWQVVVSSGGCDTTLTFVVNAPPPIQATLTTVPPSCNGECDGTASVAVSGGVAPYSFVWTPAPDAGQGTPDVTGLCAGAYSVLIADANGCDTTITFQLLEPPPIVVDLVTQPAGCGGQCIGSATATVSGGVGPYTFAWSPEPGGGQGTPNATGLCSGAYTLTVTDANGCEVIVPFTISAPAGIDAQGTVTDASCSGACDGAVQVTATGGVAPYAFVWSPEPGSGQGTPNAGGLCAGTWTLQITDAAFCDTILQFTINEPAPIIPNGTSTNETCNGPCDGTASVNPSGGLAPYSFVWTPAPPNGQGTPSVTGLCAGAWSVTITDAAGCDTTVVFDILEQQPVDAVLTVVDGICANTCEGSASVVPSGGLAPYTFNWTPAPPVGQGTASVSGLCIGAWAVTVTDAAGCDTTIAFTINAPPPIQSGLTVVPESCQGACTGSAQVVPAGGVAPIAIQWSPEPGGGQGTPNATGLCEGTNYTVTLTDVNGCTEVFPFTVDPYVPIVPNSSSTPVTCANLCNGTATVGPTGGIAPYTYAWSPEPGSGQGAPSVTGLCAGVATVVITDAAGCSVSVDVLITGPTLVDVQATTTNVSCAGQCDGSVVLNTTGGVAPYTYLWNPVPPNGQGGSTATGLCPGTWNVVVTDQNGCTQPFSFNITEPAPLLVDVATTPSQCQVCIGAATATITGGTLGYTISWTDPLGAVIGSDPTITDRCAGVYILTVSDANGCTVQQAVPIVDSDGEVLTMTDGATSCPNTCDGAVSVSFTCSDPLCTIAWTDAAGNALSSTANDLTGLCPGDYLAVVTNASGCITIDTATVVAPPPTQLNTSSSPVSCAGACDGTATVGVVGGTAPYAFVWSPEPGAGQGTPFASGLCAGVYTVVISDGAGCDTTAQVLITEPQPLDVGADVNAPGCAGQCDGSIVLSLSGGTAPYTILWSNGQTGGGIFGLCAGTYSVLVTDANGCSLSASYDLVEPDPLAATISSTPSTCPNCDGTASLSITGGTAPYTITWTLGGTVVGNGTDLTDLCGGLYTALAEDANGCSVTALVTIADANAEVLVMQDGQTSCGNTCDGSVGVLFTCSSPVCSTIWTDANGTVIAQNVLTLDDLCVGVYTVQVTNGSNCVSFGTAEVLPSQQIVPNLSTTLASCAGVCDATATVGPTGGVAPYSYTWSPEPGSGQGTPQAGGLCAGTYSVTITDAAGCDTTVQALILEPQELLIDGVQTNVSCDATCDGTVTTVISGGTAPYTFLWSPAPAVGQGTSAVSGLCAGDITLTVTDASGCSSDRTWTILGPQPLALTGSSTQSQCGLCNGVASVDITGGTAPYAVTWTQGGAIVGTGPTLSDRCAGIYVAEVVDANLCTSTLVVPISDVEGEELTTTDDVTSCPGVCDGVVNVTFNCTEIPCFVAWFDGAGNDLNEPSGELSGVCAGTYYVQVTNGLGCVSIDTAFVTEPDPIIPNLSTTPTSCASSCDGTATVGPTGGTSPYTYLWSPEPGSGQGTPQATGLCPGANEVTITDDAGCVLVVPVLILAPDTLAMIGTITPVSCNGSCDGEIAVSVTGGVAPYQYVWSPAPGSGQGTPNVEALCAGTWTLTVTDANGCTLQQDFVLDDPPVLVVDLSSTDNSCFGACDGTATLSISGGVPAYAITWSDPNGNTLAEDITAVADLCAGDYSVVVTDANGCAITSSFTISQPAAIEAGLVFTGETCFGPCDGTASVSPSGGTGPYTIVWQPEPGSGQGTEQVTALCAGDYAVIITDASGCDTTYAFTVQPFTAITDNATVTNVLCNGACNGAIQLATAGGLGGYTYNWSPVPPNGQGQDNAQQLCLGDWSVTITDVAGCSSTFTYTITEPTPLLVSVDQVTAASCATALDGAIAVSINGGVGPYGTLWTGPGGFTSSNEDLSGNAPGTYTLTVTDANGCIVTAEVTVDALVTVLANAGPDQQLCDGLAVILDGSGSTGGTQFSWTDDQGAEVGTTPVITLSDLGPGTHTFTLTVTDGPCSSTDEVVIEVLELPLADAGPDQFIFLSGTANLGGSPGIPGNTYSWSPDSLVSDPNAATTTADPSVTTWFVLTVSSPEGCVDVDSVLVTVVPDVVIPSGFTPNGDGRNDTWVIDFIDLFPDCEVEVYNRWGEQLFRSVGYQVPWDGRYRDGYVPVGTYYYVVNLKDPRFPDAYTGPLTVIR
jgi:gliding motility-associated-like protein